MSGTSFYVFVEGDDDARFFERILVPMLKGKGKTVQIIQYAQKAKKLDWVAKFARSIESQGNDWVFVTDLERAPCVTAKKEEVEGKFVRAGVKHPRIAVVVKMIESWYLAGMTEIARRELGIRGRVPRNTEGVDKGRFNSLIPQHFDSRVDFMLEVLKRFSVESAKQRNRSFRYWLENYDC